MGEQESFEPAIDPLEVFFGETVQPDPETPDLWLPGRFDVQYIARKA